MKKNYSIRLMTSPRFWGIFYKGFLLEPISFMSYEDAHAYLTKHYGVTL